MFAIIKTGGKQYKVAANQVIEVERLDGDAGAKVAFDDVLLIGDGEAVMLGAPTVAGASVTGEVVKQARGAKVYAFKKRRRQNSKRIRGHRQHLTQVRIVEILAEGKKPRSRKAKAGASEADAAAGE
jgi:large subunit ribosomal protein L21